jgi:hypothetical protein
MSEVIRFNPALGLYRWRFESAPGVANEAGRWHDLNNFKGEKIGANSLLVPRTALSRGGMRPQSLIGKLEPGGDTEFDAFQPRQEWPFWALLLHGYDVPSGPLAGETAAYRHKIHRLGASAFPDTAEIRLDRNTGQITRYREVRGGGVQLKLAGKQLVSTMYTTVVGRFDYWGDAIQTGTGTAAPQLRGVNAVNNPALGSTPLDFYMKVTAQTSTTVTVTTKRGSAATYGAPYVIPRSSPAAPVWWLVLDENGVAMGQFTGIATEIYLPASGTFVVNDEFHWPAVCPDWTTGSPTWPYAPPPMIAVNEVLSSYAVAGGQILNFDTADLTIKSGAETKHEFGGRMPSRTREWGFQTVDGKIAREEQPGFSFQPYLVEGVPFDSVINLSSGVRLGTSGLYDYNSVLTMKNVVPKGKTNSVEGEKSLPGGIDFEANSSGDSSYPSDITLETQNEIPSLLAADAFA